MLKEMQHKIVVKRQKNKEARIRAGLIYKNTYGKLK